MSVTTQASIVGMSHSCCAPTWQKKLCHMVGRIAYELCHDIALLNSKHCTSPCDTSTTFHTRLSPTPPPPVMMERQQRAIRHAFSTHRPLAWSAGHWVAAACTLSVQLPYK